MTTRRWIAIAFAAALSAACTGSGGNPLAVGDGPDGMAPVAPRDTTEFVPM